jgi:hypothetical protein
MKGPRTLNSRRLTAVVIVVALLSAIGGFGAASKDQAVGQAATPPPPPPTCSTLPIPVPSGIAYDSGSNTIILCGPGGGGPSTTWTLTQIKSALPGAPLTHVAPAVWELDANLYLQLGAVLQLHGATAGVPGDVSELRIQSEPDNLPTDVNALIAEYGRIDIDSVHITSWDRTVNGPDTNDSTANPPAGQACAYAPGPAPPAPPLCLRGRAFVTAFSFPVGAGPNEPSPTAPPVGQSTLGQSAMTVYNSTVEYLGYYGPDSFGVTYKTERCQHAQPSPGPPGDPAACNNLSATGFETANTFRLNFMGTFTWGAANMNVTYNQFYNNIMYGFDSHDLTRNILIDHNHSSYNGDHGIICSQACDHLTITNNEVDHNGMVPWGGPLLDPEEARQVHGIMMHRGVTISLIAANYVHDQPNGVGVALFDSGTGGNGDVVEDNTLVDNAIGVRISGGANSNSILNNTVTNLPGFAPDVALVAQYGLLIFQGVQPPLYNPTSDPTNNTIAGNTFNLAGQGASPLRAADDSHDVFSGNVFNQPNGPLLFEQSAPGSVRTGDVLSANSLPAGQLVKADGTAPNPASLTVTDLAGPLSLEAFAFSTIGVTSGTGQVFQTAPAIPTTVTPAGSSLTLVAPAKPVMVSPTAVTVQPSSGTATASAVGGAGGAIISVTLPARGPTVSISDAGYVPGRRYPVTRGRVPLAPVTSDGTGTVRFSDAPPAAGTFLYTVGNTGYWLVASDGGIFSFSVGGFDGSHGGSPLNAPIVGMASTADGRGYWLVATDGGIFTYGDAAFYGSTGNVHLNRPIVGMASTPDGGGYWLVASDGGIFTFGDAAFYGSTGNVHLNRPIVGMASTPDGRGYLLVATDGGIFTFGDAGFYGSTGNIHLNQPIVGMASTSTGRGYWLVASDGGIFTFGDAPFSGSMGGVHLNKPIVGMTSTIDGRGYLMVATDGGIFTFGDAAFSGSTGNIALNRPVIGMATTGP